MAIVFAKTATVIVVFASTTKIVIMSSNKHGIYPFAMTTTRLVIFFCHKSNNTFKTTTTITARVFATTTRKVKFCIMTRKINNYGSVATTTTAIALVFAMTTTFSKIVQKLSKFCKK